MPISAVSGSSTKSIKEPTMASHFNDPGVTRLYLALLDHLFPRESAGSGAG